MNMNNFYNLVDGKIGKVVDGIDFDENSKFICEGVEYKLVENKEVVFDIDDLIDVIDVDKDLVLMRSDGYRGVCCYEGIVKRNDGKLFWIDIVSDWVGYEIEVI